MPEPACSIPRVFRRTRERIHMKTAHFLGIGIGLWALAVLGCAAPLSQQARSQVTYQGPFSALIKEPDRYVGETVILGGKIIEVAASEDRSELILLQLPLSRGLHPVEEDRSEGRFIVRSLRFLDPEIFKKGLLVTAVGRLKGVEKRPIGSFNYAYPFLEEVEIRLWPKRFSSGPMFHFGLGVGMAF